MKIIALLSCLMLFSLSVSGITGGANTDGMLIVPNVEGISVALATQSLNMVGLLPRLASAVSPAALVVRQEPRPGSTLPPGGEVVLATSPTDNLSRIASTTDTRTIMPPTTVIVNDGANRSLSTENPNTLTSSGVSGNQGQEAVQGLHILTLSDGQGTAVYQAPQPRVSPYFTQSTTPRLYPAWYPKHLLTQVAGSPAGGTVQSGTGSPSITGTQPGSTVLQRVYPRVEPYRTGYTGVLGWGGVPSTTPSVGAYATSPNPAVSMPNVLRLSQTDATAALSRLGLVISTLSVDSAEGRPGVVVHQSPEAYTLIQSGSVVQLWISR